MSRRGAPRAPRPRPADAAESLARAADVILVAAGHLATVALLCLTAGLVLGIVLRSLGIDDSWTYDFDLYSLIWLAFTGAALTARRNRHVTSGIALERAFKGRLRAILRGLRVAIVVGFLFLLAISGWWNAASSLRTHETTIDVVQWPVWIAKAAIPAGAALWGIAELVKVALRALADREDR